MVKSEFNLYGGVSPKSNSLSSSPSRTSSSPKPPPHSPSALSATNNNLIHRSKTESDLNPSDETSNGPLLPGGESPEVVCCAGDQRPGAAESASVSPPGDGDLPSMIQGTDDATSTTSNCSSVGTTSTILR